MKTLLTLSLAFGFVLMSGTMQKAEARSHFSFYLGGPSYVAPPPPPYYVAPQPYYVVPQPYYVAPQPYYVAPHRYYHGPYGHTYYYY